MFSCPATVSAASANRGDPCRAGCVARVWPGSLSLGCDWDVRTGRGCWVLGAEEGAALYWVGAWQRPIPTSGDPFDLGGDGGIRIYESATRGHVNPERPYPKSITSQCPGSARSVPLLSVCYAKVRPRRVEGSLGG